ncbi:MAG: hypothetical protein ACFFB8_01670 [Promethearchaeota archaeon]
MAVSKEKSSHFLNSGLIQLSTEHKPIFQLDDRILKHNYKTLPYIAYMQILYNCKKLKDFPHMRNEYIKQINIIILHEKLFKNLILIKKNKKKSEEKNG